MKKENIITLLLITTFFMTSLSFIQAANAYDQNAYIVNYSSQNNQNSKTPDIVVQIQKYEPYPVIAGDWFDLWIKVQNIGQTDATNAAFQLIPEYPFSSNDSLIRTYGLLYGTESAFKLFQDFDSTQIVLKYRVKTEQSSPSGPSTIKLKVSADNFTTGSIYDLPIEIYSAKTTAGVPAPISEKPYLKWFYGIAGLIIGIFLVVILVLIRQKAASKHNSH